MARNYMEGTMDALLAELDMLKGVDMSDGDRVEAATRHAKAVQGIAEQVFDGQRVNNETVRMQVEFSGVSAMASAAKSARRLLEQPADTPYYAKQREAMDATENREFYEDVVADAR